jgi:hypothetical protein
MCAANAACSLKVIPEALMPQNGQAKSGAEGSADDE